MRSEAIETVLKKLGTFGCYGNSDDFFTWTRAYGGQDILLEDFTRIFNHLLQTGEIKVLDSRTSIYKFSNNNGFPVSVEYTASSLHEHIPIQFARSRLDSYLSFHKIDPDEISIILIGATEAFENAVKYNAGNTFTVHYWIQNHEFNMTVNNTMKYISVEENIRAGKFDSATTLMRGMLVMNKVFDFMDLNFSNNNQEATLVVRKKI